MASLDDIDPDDEGAVGDTGPLAGYTPEWRMAAQFGVALRTWRHWEALGETPPVTRIGRRKFYNDESTRKWLRKRQRAEVA